MQEGLSETYRFTGKPEDDDVTGLYYYGARYYDPEIGRFISQDPAKDGLNWYLYCNANPLKFIDPDGRLTVLVHGIWAKNEDSYKRRAEQLEEKIDSNTHVFKWSDRHGFSDIFHIPAHWFHLYRNDAERLANFILSEYKKGEPINIIAHSGGGQIAMEADVILGQKGVRIDILILMAAPIFEGKRPENIKTIYDLYSFSIKPDSGFGVVDILLHNLVIWPDVKRKYFKNVSHTEWWSDPNVYDYVEGIIKNSMKR